MRKHLSQHGKQCDWPVAATGGTFSLALVQKDDYTFTSFHWYPAGLPDLDEKSMKG